MVTLPHRDQDRRMNDAQECWTNERLETWVRLDAIRKEAEQDFNANRKGTWVSIHTSAPNPHGINADDTPDKWYWSVGDAYVNTERILHLLTDISDLSVSLRERPDGWEDGFWFVVENPSEL